MAYVNGIDGQQFGGFGSDDDLDAALKAKLGAGLARAAKGVDTKHLPDVLKQAEALGKKYFGTSADDAKNKAFQFLYLQATSAMSSVMQKGAIDVAKRMANEGITVGTQASNIYQKLKSDEPIDASGMMDMASAGQKIIKSLLNVGKQLGLVNNSQMNEVMEWTNVAAGCAAAAGTMPPYVAAAACTLQFVGKLIPALNKTDSGPPSQYPRAIFATSSKDQLIIAATDAERLARVLKYKYGVQSYEQLFLRCFKNNSDNIEFDDGTVSEASFFNNAKYPLMNSNMPKAAVDMRVALVLMRFQGPDSPGLQIGIPSTGPLSPDKFGGNSIVIGNGTNPWLATRHVLSRIANLEAAGTAGRDHTDRDISSQYIYDHDVNVPAIDVGADWWKKYKAQRNAFGLDAFKRVHELINFFTAITQQEFSIGQRSVMQYVAPYKLPVQLYGVNDNDGGGCRDNFYDTEGCTPYGKRCLTSLDRCYLGTNECHRWPEQLNNSGHKQHLCAMRMLGSLRMMAAFSYMHLVYMRSFDSGVAMKSRDMIADLPPSNDPAITLEMTVDVNQTNADGARWPRPLPHILQAIKIKAKQVGDIKKLAEGLAKKDQITRSIHPDLLKQFQQTAAQQASAPSSTIMDMIKSGQTEMSTMLAARQKCLNSGGQWYPGGAACDVAADGTLTNCRAPTAATHKKYSCVPQGTPGASNITASGEVSKGPSVGTILTVAGAGLLLMRLLKA